MNRAFLTPRQEAILRFLTRFHNEHGRPPTRQELCAAFGFRSPNAAQCHLQALAEKGLIAIDRGRARGIRLLVAAEAVLDAERGRTASPAAEGAANSLDDAGLPVIGKVAAGAPILATPHIEAYHPIAPTAFRPRADYLLRVVGDSMIHAGILPGDLVAVRQTPEAPSGAIVVARIDDEVTVKRLVRRNSETIELYPENPAYAPIRIDPTRHHFALEGVVVGLVRPSLS
ncbi:transcriptional repressor LexA [Hydrogenophilus thiooxidans]|uniref:transcriptional repressor LexA n=1 Tax=Hydrogenophilus thiooxidans TaxID=2820326 RepID=UPI001C2217D5|nr:transcriptional repressor LexA [Hydrogenophilus thiooxidans]